MGSSLVPEHDEVGPTTRDSSSSSATRLDVATEQTGRFSWLDEAYFTSSTPGPILNDDTSPRSGSSGEAVAVGSLNPTSSSSPSSRGDAPPFLVAESTRRMPSTISTTSASHSNEPISIIPSSDRSGYVVADPTPSTSTLACGAREPNQTPGPSTRRTSSRDQGWHIHQSPIDTTNSFTSTPTRNPPRPPALSLVTPEPALHHPLETPSSRPHSTEHDTRPLSLVSYGNTSLGTSIISSNSSNEAEDRGRDSAQHARGWAGLGIVGDEEETATSPLRPNSSTIRLPAALTTGVRRKSTLSERVGRGLKTISVRVVNLAGNGDEVDEEERFRTPSKQMHPHQRLPSLDDVRDEVRDEEDSDEANYEKAFRRLRGKSLGLFGPRNWLRRGCAKLLAWRFTEPFILLLIIASVIVLTIQAAPDVYTHPRPNTGYFHGWEDYALFAIFCAFTVEMLVRIVVTGLVFNPPPPESFSVLIRAPSIDAGHRSSMTRTRTRDRSPIGVRDPYAPLPSPRGNGETSIVSAVVRQLKQSPVNYPPKSPRSPSSPIPSPIQRHFSMRRRPSHSPDRDVPKPLPTDTLINPKDPFVDTVVLPEELSVHPPRLVKASTTTSNWSGRLRTPFASALHRQRHILYSRAYLRSSWNRLDVVAIFSFWIGFALSVCGVATLDGVDVFRALSVLRAMRLLSVTTGTTTILHSLKRASPQLVNVGFFVAFAMTLFSIIGVQSFKSSYRRNCRWIDPTGQLPFVDFPLQHCGSYYNATTGARENALSTSGLPSTEKPKGFICPAPSVCISTENPDDGALSFDNIFAALYQVTIIASANTWTVIMYAMMDADYFVSCLFFIVCLIVLNYWLWNLFVAVITSSFAAIREETRHSAFAATSVKSNVTGSPDDGGLGSPSKSKGFNRTARWVLYAYKKTSLVWVLLALLSISAQAAATYDMPPGERSTLSTIELYVTLAFGVEIIVRFYASMPDWRAFFHRTRNVVDLGLVVATAVIQVPVIKNSDAYPWLTGFQIARFYRVVLAIPRMRRLLRRVLGTFKGLVNMIIFLMLMTYVASLIAVQLFRGVPDPSEVDTTVMTFYQSYNAFVAMYQILSSENWTAVVNNVLSAESSVFSTAIAAIFLSCWLLFGYFILINMFIAVINENFSIPEEEKRKLQLEAFEKRNDESKLKKRWWHRLNPYHFDRSGRSAMIAPPLSRMDGSEEWSPGSLRRRADKVHVRERSRTGSLFGKAQRALGLSSGTNHEGVALDDIHAGDVTQEYQGTLFPLTSQAERDAGIARAQARERRANLAAFIAKYPSYDRSLWIISPKNWMRRLCQKFVDPAYGDERLNGLPADRVCRLAFQTLVFTAIVGSVIIAAIATPAYRRDYFLKHGMLRWTWFNLTECGLGMIFVAEFLVKVIADGFLLSPNAYLLSVYNDLDFFVLITLVVNVITALVAGPSLNRFTRALKAFRALRLINLWPVMRETFYNVLIVGFSRILDATLLAILYIVPFAIWAHSIFGGLLYSCNDGSVSFKGQCSGEFVSAAVSDWDFLQPRSWDNPSGNPSVWTFDTFRASLLILFEIISLEGWVDVMESVMQITAQDEQPQQNAWQWAGLFFVLFNLVGAVFILTLFVSTIIENFRTRSGMAFLTTEQTQWLNLRRLISRQRPAKRPKRRPTSAFRAWCFDRATQKHGWWSRGITGVYCANVIVLCTQATTNISWADDLRNYIFLGFTVVYCVDIFIRTHGLGWSSFFQNGWNQYDVLVVAGTLATTIPIVVHVSSQATTQLQKVFLVLVAFKLVQRNNSLNQLFKTAVASVPALLNIFCLWLVLFLVWAIFNVEVFGLTRWQYNETHNANYSTFLKALVLLALQSTGEGWNAFMHDFMIEFPRCTTSPDYLFSDCGSTGWAIVLFITWNVLSMYLMANLILGAVIENFSYVFQSWGNVNYPDREQMRQFKKAWGEIDVERTGYIRRRDLVKFFSRLTGIFEVRIYRAEWTIKKLRDAATVPSTITAVGTVDASSRLERDASTIDVYLLVHAMRAIDGTEVRQRRYLYNRLYHEAMIDAERDERGISFTNMLLLLAHYRLIDDDNALRVDELLDRREKQDRVMERVNSDNVRGLLQTLTLRRRFLAYRAARRAGGRGPPEIRVELPVESPSTDGPRRGNLTIDTGALPRWDEDSAESASSREPSPTRREGLTRRRRTLSTDRLSVASDDAEDTVVRG